MNELSLSGQFANFADFFEKIKTSLKIFEVLNDLRIPIYKNYSFFDCRITPLQVLSDLLRIKGNEEIRKLRNQILEFSLNPPYWQDAPRHNCNDTYSCNYTKLLCEYGLAEAVEYNNIIFSFPHQEFSNEEVLIKKNSVDISLFNLHHFIQVQQWLLDCIRNDEYVLDVLPELFPRISLSNKLIDANKIQLTLEGLSHNERIPKYEKLGELVAVTNSWLFSQRLSHLNNRTVFEKRIQSENHYLTIDTQHGTFELHRGSVHLAEYNFKGEITSGPVAGRTISL